MTRLRKLDRSGVAAGGFTLAYLLFSSVWAFNEANLEFLLYVAVVFFFASVVAAVHFRVGLHPGSLWALSFWGFAHMAGGLVTLPASWPTAGESHVLYSLWLIPGVLKYDHIVHAYGFGIATWVCWQGINHFISRDAAPQHTTGLLFLTACMGMGLGALNEVIEFLVTLLVPETNVGGYVNTGWDLVANLIGAVIAVLFIRSRYAGKMM